MVGCGYSVARSADACTLTAQLLFVAVIMRGLFALSYALLWGLIVLEAVVLREVLRKTLWFKRLYADFSRRSEPEKLNWLPTGTLAPDFMAPLLWTGELLSTSHLGGNSSILLFVSPEAPSSLYEKLSLAIHVMWHNTDGHLYLVCNGSEEACQQLARDHRVEGFTEDKVPVILDKDGWITRSFLIDSTPQAVSLGEDLRVKRYGRPAPNEQAAENRVESSQMQPDSASPGGDDRQSAFSGQGIG